MKKVAIGVVLKGQEVLLIRRMDKEPGLDWCFPGGGIEDGEWEEAAVTREIAEETGIACVPVKKLGDVPHPVKSGLTKAYWLCDYVSGDARIIEPDRHEAVEWISIEKAAKLLEMDYTPRVQDLFVSMMKAS